MVTKVKYWSLHWTLTITHRASGFNSKHKNWEHPPPVPFCLSLQMIQSGAHEEGHITMKSEKPGRGEFRDHYVGKIHSSQNSGIS